MRNEINAVLKGLLDGYLTQDQCADKIEQTYREQHGVDLLELGRRIEQISDINQWAALIINNKVENLRPRIIRGIVGDILNRTTD